LAASRTQSASSAFRENWYRSHTAWGGIDGHVEAMIDRTTSSAVSPPPPLAAVIVVIDEEEEEDDEEGGGKQHERNRS
jgi:hypothetical protein